MHTPAEPPAWHQALAYAVSGRRYPELGRQDRPDVAAVAAFLLGRLQEGVELGRYPLPPQLSAGIGPAQFSAAVSALRTHLDQAQDQGPRVVPVVADRPLSADERRLLGEVPPHHGS